MRNLEDKINLLTKQIRTYKMLCSLELPYMAQLRECLEFVFRMNNFEESSYLV